MIIIKKTVVNKNMYYLKKLKFRLKLKFLNPIIFGSWWQKSLNSVVYIKSLLNQVAKI